MNFNSSIYNNKSSSTKKENSNTSGTKIGKKIMGKVTTNINVKDKKDCYSCMFYMNYATGVYSTKNLKGLDDVYAKTQNERLNNIIAKAKNDKIYDSNDPLKLGSQIKE